jgi:aminoglycoside phosphotransferase (APT) family kinase protein
LLENPVAHLEPILRMLGLQDSADLIVEPLTGGVSSDILKITSGRQVFAVKRALPKLKVAADWRAPVDRNRFEVAWLRKVRGIAPEAVPEILAHDPDTGTFAMTFLDPATYPVWKAQLRGGNADVGFAAAVGRILGRIHRATAGDPSVAQQFQTDYIFHPIRLEPYLEATARRHPTVADRLMRLSEETLRRKEALVHGDVSPKNILAGPGGPIFLDAECAWYGDPAFDLAFCLNHLLLKCLWNPPAADLFLRCFDALSAAYLAEVRWSAADDLERRAAHLLPGLFLARIDGKSPVEYVTDEADKDLVRATAIPLLADPTNRLGEIRSAWANRINAS